MFCCSEKYATFWDPSKIIRRLAQSTPRTVRQLRDRVILCSRLFGLHRSIDLARKFRTVSVVDGRYFLKVQRKGWKTPRWEEVVSIPEHENISPWHFIRSYVAQTAHLVQSGGPLLITEKPPFRGLTANSVGRLTKHALAAHGIPMQHWGPHSTRGAWHSCKKNRFVL